jgi:hypothetical protein
MPSADISDHSNRRTALTPTLPNPNSALPATYSPPEHRSRLRIARVAPDVTLFTWHHLLEHIEYIDRQITIGATGGLLTMLSESGSGTLAGSAHSETFMQIARSDAVLLSGVLQRDIDVPILNRFFPGQPVQAYFEFAPVVSQQSSRIVSDAVQLAGAGVPIDTKEIAEKTGYDLKAEEELGPAAVQGVPGSAV